MNLQWQSGVILRQRFPGCLEKRLLYAVFRRSWMVPSENQKRAFDNGTEAFQTDSLLSHTQVNFRQRAVGLVFAVGAASFGS